MCDSCPCNPPSKAEMDEAFAISKAMDLFNRNVYRVYRGEAKWQIDPGDPLFVRAVAPGVPA